MTNELGKKMDRRQRKVKGVEVYITNDRVEK